MRLRMKPYHIPLFSLLLGVGIDAVAQDKYLVQPSDCVNVRYLSTDFFHRPIQINPQGTRFAYLVKSPNIATDHNDVQIYTRHVGPPQEAEQKPILVGQNISEIRWLSDGIHLALL